tara:strand:+ start:461 stop:622 length:162 start_codon:yes stop_codon:yes gene_type:complete
MTKGSAKKGTVEGICILTDLVPQVGIEEQLDTNKNAIKTITFIQITPFLLAPF